MLKAASEISYDISSTSSDKLSGKRPRSHLVESSNRLETSFESYFGVERSASNSDVVRIRVPFSREDALHSMKKPSSSSAVGASSTLSTADQNKIRIAVQQNGSGNGSGNGSSQSSPRKSPGSGLEADQSFNQLVKKSNHVIKSNSKS